MSVEILKLLPSIRCTSVLTTASACSIMLPEYTLYFDDTARKMMILLTIVLLTTWIFFPRSKITLSYKEHDDTDPDRSEAPIFSTSLI